MNNAKVAKKIKEDEIYCVYHKNTNNFIIFYQTYIRINRFENYEHEELLGLMVFCVVFIHNGAVVYYMCGMGKRVFFVKKTLNIIPFPPR